ncbi:MAG: NBR1-Ig-like domain-containing protein [Anaerolineales bacterium]|nr:MAG: NBR1-Ig-like domain-containing protein [Anaerolineales bacterium]
MTHHTKRILFTALSILFLVSACLPQPQATPNPVDIANQVATSVALTVSAAQAQTEAAQPVATNTTLPTQTEAVPPSPTALIPSATPFVIVPPTATIVVSSGGGGGGTAPKPALDCTPINNKPRDLTVFKKGNEFDIVWTIVNTGTKTIPANLDIKYISGTKLMKNPTDTFREFGVDLKPGESVKIIIDAVAPAEKGKHVMEWIVEGNLCRPYVAIVVE